MHFSLLFVAGMLRLWCEDRDTGSKKTYRVRERMLYYDVVLSIPLWMLSKKEEKSQQMIVFHAGQINGRWNWWRECQVVNFHFSSYPIQENSARSMNDTAALLPHREFSLLCCEKSKNFPYQKSREHKSEKFSPNFPSALRPRNRNENETETRSASKYFFPRSLSVLCRQLFVSDVSHPFRIGTASDFAPQKKENKKSLKAKSIFWWCENSNNGNGACNCCSQENSLEKNIGKLKVSLWLKITREKKEAKIKYKIEWIEKKKKKKLYCD